MYITFVVSVSQRTIPTEWRITPERECNTVNGG